MKSGHTAGIVAGFITGIASLIFGGMGAQIFILELPLSTILEFLPFTATTHIGFNLVYGVIFGILFAKFYDVIPGKSGFKKGLFWGFIYAIVPEWWLASYSLAHGNFPTSFLWGYCGLIVIIFYGPPLGFLYKGTQQLVKAEDKRKHKPVAGVIAGLVGGVVTSIFAFISFIMKIPDMWAYPDYHIAPITTVPIEFILAVIWGIIFGVIFVVLYPRLPGRNVMKGLYYGLILFLLAEIYGLIWGLAYANVLQSLLLSVINYGLAFISYGIVLGYFYKK
jgi:hypothetical protein